MPPAAHLRQTRQAVDLGDEPVFASSLQPCYIETPSETADCKIAFPAVAGRLSGLHGPTGSIPPVFRILQRLAPGTDLRHPQFVVGGSRRVQDHHRFICPYGRSLYI